MRIANEHFPVRSRLTCMRRANVALFLLLPALWVFLCAQGFAIPCDNCGIFGSQDVTCSLQPCKGSAGDVLVSPNSSTVRAATRTGKNFGKSHLPSLDPLARSHGNGRTLTISFPESQSPFTIATCWQFDCRAARHPRAPTLVS